MLIDDYIDTVEKNEKHHSICKERWDDKNRLVLTNERIIVDNKINWKYLWNYQLGKFLHTPIRNEESWNRLVNFGVTCFSNNAPLTHGYYFKEDEHISLFIKGLLAAYFGEKPERFRHTGHLMDSEEIVDQKIGKDISIATFHAHELFFIVNSYNRNCESKRHKALYDIVNTIGKDRALIGYRTFILSLTYDVGPDKGQEHGFSIPMFPIKKIIKEVLEAKENGKDPWKSF